MAHITDHAGIFKKGPTDSLDVQPFIAVTVVNVMLETCSILVAVRVQYHISLNHKVEHVPCIIF